MIGAFRSVYCSGQSIFSQTVSSVYCLSVLVSLISVVYKEQEAVGIGLVAFVLN